MSKFRLLTLSDLTGTTRHAVFDYIRPLANITDFAIASGTFSYTNDDNIIASNYWLDNSSKDPTKAIIVDINGEFDCLTKMDKYQAGVRVAVKYSDIKDYITSEIEVEDNLSVVLFGNYPKDVLREISGLDFLKLTDKNKIQKTNESIQLPVQNSGMFSKFSLEEKPIYEYKGINFIEYPIQHVAIKLKDNKSYFIGQPVLFKVEPIRWWVDKEIDLAITQDVIIGGLPFRSSMGEYSYEDEEDISEYLEYFEENLFKTLDIKVKKKNKGKK